jgi:hypothetical protein
MLRQLTLLECDVAIELRVAHAIDFAMPSDPTKATAPKLTGHLVARVRRRELQQPN